MSELREMLMEAFRVECREHLEGMRSALGREPVDMDEAFRHAHSLKAAARVCELESMAVLGQRLEALFGRARRDKTALSPAELDAARLGVEAVESWSQALEAGRKPEDVGEASAALDRVLGARESGPEPPRPQAEPSPLDRELLAAFMVEHREHLEGIRAILAAVEGETSAPEQIDEAFRRAHSLKGAARVAEVRAAEVVAHRLESLFARVREGLPLSPEVIQAIHGGLEFIEDAVACLVEGRPAPDPAEEIRKIDRVGAAPSPPREPSEERLASRSPQEAAPLTTAASLPRDEAMTRGEGTALRLGAEHLDQLLRSAEHLLVEGLGQEHVSRELADIERAARELARDALAGRKAARDHRTVDLERLQIYLHRIEERTAALLRSVRAVRRTQQQTSHTFRQLGRQLQHDVRRVRTVPAESVFQGFRKMVRSLAAEQGKEVEFRLTGLEVQADREVLQALKDPLMHVLRNAVVHGIEPPEERSRLGKPPTGHVALLLEVKGGRLHIRAEDDGRGLDRAKICAEAVRSGLLAPGQEMSEAELDQLVFQPGFSTAGAITSLAGRGMGLSVVQEVVARLQGEVSFSRSQKSSTCITLSVPLSVSAQRLLLVLCGGQTLAVPFAAIEELIRVPRREIEVVGGRPMLLLRGELIPYRPLGPGLGLADIQGELLSVLVLRVGGARQALGVDAFVEESRTLLKDLDAPARSETWAGAVLREDGTVCLVLNPAGLLQGGPLAGKPSPAQSPAAIPPPPARKKTPIILVVDDSLTTRTLEKSILEAHGYQVRLALDGQEALNQLRHNLADLVITDIQMPRLDGFGLLAAMKKDERLAQVPVIVVSSLERREDVERGLALGADAYVVKRKFDHEELLQTVRQLL